LSNAIGSLNEIDTQLERLGYLTETDYDRVYQPLDECLALTYGLRKAVKSKRQAENRKQRPDRSLLTANNAL